MTSKIGVRAYRPEDESALVALWEVCFPSEPPRNNPADVIRYKLSVQPDLLMNTVEGALAVLGCPKLNIQVHAENAAVVEFYENAGFSVEDRISMSKQLQPEQ